MQEPEAPVPAVAPNHDRLHTWKEIASYLGKGVRTVERWEEELGLPVHRVPGKRGDTVWASKTELDAWLVRVAEKHRADAGPESTTGAGPAPDPPGPAPSGNGRKTTGRTGRWLLVAASVVVLLVAGVAAVQVLFSGFVGPTLGPPALWEVADGQLVVRDAARKFLWNTAFSPPLPPEQYMSGAPRLGGCRKVEIADLDGDGTPEVLLIAQTMHLEEWGLYVFEHDGRERFVHQPGRTVTMGGKAYSPPFLPSQFLLTSDGNGGRLIWLVAPHNYDAPAVLEKIEPRGTVLGGFFSAGHFGIVADGELTGRQVIMFGGISNEHHAGALTVLDADAPSGSTPTVSEAFRFTDVPAGGPLAYLVFPTMPVARALDSPADVTEIRFEQGDTFMVTVTQGVLSSPGERIPATVYYTFDSDFRLLNAEIGSPYRHVHKNLELSGAIDHPLDATEEATLFPVRMWDGKSLVEVQRR